METLSLELLKEEEELNSIEEYQRFLYNNLGWEL